MNLKNKARKTFPAREGEVKGMKIEANGYLLDIKTLKNNNYTNIYRSVIFFPVRKEQLAKNDIFLIAELENCDGSIEKIREKIREKINFQLK